MNTLEFNLDAYFPDDSDDINAARISVYDDVLKTLKMLLRNGYIATIRENYKGMLVIEYEYDNHIFNNAQDTLNPYWITRSEYNIIQTHRNRAEEFNLRLP